MSQNYRINKNSKFPSSEEIQKLKDFDALLENFNATKPKPKPNAGGNTIIRTLTIIGGAIAAAVVGIIFFFTIGKDNQIDLKYDQAQAEFFQAQPYINPPLKAVPANFSEQSISADEGGVIEYKSGSRIIIPRGAFVAANGEPVAGQVAIHFREMHDFVDFFLSGIPMTYDSAQTKYALESAGMIEIIAEQNGKRVNLAPEKPIQVELVSEILAQPVNIPPRYNIYKLDTLNRNWVYQNVDQIQFQEDEALPTVNLSPAQKIFQDEITQINNKAAKALEELEASIPLPVKPKEPIKHVGERPTLELDFEEDNVELAGNGNLQELKQLYEGTIWQISDRSANYSPADLGQTWTNIRMAPLNNRDFELTLVGTEKEVTLIVSPVLMGNDFIQAKNRYEAGLKEYQLAFEEREAKLSEKRAAIQKQVESDRLAAIQTYEQNQADLQVNSQDAVPTLVRRKIVNRFKVSSCGVWNCDRPVPIEKQRLAASFTDQNGKALDNQAAYLVNRNQNTVRQFLAKGGAPVHFDKNSDNLLWMVTAENKIAIYRADSFKGIKNDAKEHTFVMQVVDRTIQSEEDVRSILQF